MKLTINRAVRRTKIGVFELVTPVIYQFEITDSDTGISLVSAWFHSESEDKIEERVGRFVANLRGFVRNGVEYRDVEFGNISVTQLDCDQDEGFRLS